MHHLSLICEAKGAKNFHNVKIQCLHQPNVFYWNTRLLWSRSLMTMLGLQLLKIITNRYATITLSWD